MLNIWTLQVQFDQFKIKTFLILESTNILYTVTQWPMMPERKASPIDFSHTSSEPLSNGTSMIYVCGSSKQDSDRVRVRQTACRHDFLPLSLSLFSILLYYRTSPSLLNQCPPFVYFLAIYSTRSILISELQLTAPSHNLPISFYTTNKGFVLQ